LLRYLCVSVSVNSPTSSLLRIITTVLCWLNSFSFFKNLTEVIAIRIADLFYYIIFGVSYRDPGFPNTGCMLQQLNPPFSLFRY
jgi:hypothetical protein